MSASDPKRTGRKNFLNTHLVDEMQSDALSSDRLIDANPVDHCHYECAIIHIQPVGAANELIRSIACGPEET